LLCLIRHHQVILELSFKTFFSLPFISLSYLHDPDCIVWYSLPSLLVGFFWFFFIDFFLILSFYVGFIWNSTSIFFSTDSSRSHNLACMFIMLILVGLCHFSSLLLLFLFHFLPFFLIWLAFSFVTFFVSITVFF